jgi:hypothetical protein
MEDSIPISRFDFSFLREITLPVVSMIPVNMVAKV